MPSAKVTNPPPSDLELGALLASKICHDALSPVSSIINGFEILEESKSAETETYALELIRNVSEQAKSRLEFYRLAFGAAASSGSTIDLATAEKLSRGVVGTSKHKLDWKGPNGVIAKDYAKLVLNLVSAALNALPRGGEILVETRGPLDRPSFFLTAKGTGARPPNYLPDFIAENGQVPINAMTVQSYLTWRLAMETHSKLTIDRSGLDVVISSMAGPA